MGFLLLLLIPLAVSGTTFLVLRATVTWKEFLLQLGLSVITLIVGWQIAKWSSLSATENLNGRITHKEAGTQSCCHCQSRCVSRDNKGNCTSSVRECSHIWDHYWSLHTSVGNIGVESCSGDSTPPQAWVRAQVGEPASVEHSYTNYLLADPDSLMVRSQSQKFESRIPEYPEVRHLYKIDHVIGDVTPPAGFQNQLREINADLGASNQVDVTVILTSEKDPTYAQALEAKWLYGPKNSLNIVMGIDNDTIRWVRVVTISKVEMLKVRMRDQLQGLRLDDPKVPATIRQEVAKGFKRTAMAEFEYLAANASPTGGSLALLVLVQFLVSLGLTIWMHQKDVFGDKGFTKYKMNWS